MKILIVDDSKKARQMIRQFLNFSAEEMQECDDGEKALTIYREFLPDWVLMDWEMEQVNGLTATRQIINEFPQAQILIVTNYDENDLRQAAQKAGAKGFILKDDLISLHDFLK